MVVRIGALSFKVNQYSAGNGKIAANKPCEFVDGLLRFFGISINSLYGKKCVVNKVRLYLREDHAITMFFHKCQFMLPNKA